MLSQMCLHQNFHAMNLGNHALKFTAYEASQFLQWLFSALVNSLSSPLNSILPFLKSTKSLKKILKPFHAIATKSGEIHDPFVSAEVLRCSVLSDDRILTYARVVFDQMPEPNLFLLEHPHSCTDREWAWPVRSYWCFLQYASLWLC
jgi:hypothetical protein